MSIDSAGTRFTLKFLGFLLAAILAAKFGIGIAFSYVQKNSYDISTIEREIALAKLHRLKYGASLASVFSPVAYAGNTAKLAFVGDIMLDRGVEESLKNYGNGDFRYSFLNIYETLNDYDFLFANLEGPVSDKGSDQGPLYSFRMDPLSLNGLLFAGFDIVSVANNHIGDWGEEAIRDTLERLKRAGILYVGAGFDAEDAYSPRIASVNDTTVAYVAFSQFPGSWREEGNGIYLALASDEKIKKSIQEAAEEADIVVASFHFGEEYRDLPDSYQKAIARFAIDAGADLVIGHHPHVVQPVESYRNGYIVYSLGNFVFDQDFSPETMEGMLLEVEIMDKQIVGITPREIKINPRFQPELVSP